MPLPVLNCHSSSPLFASYALNIPFGSPAKTSPPAVDRSDDTIGCGPFHCHTWRPLAGSNARTLPDCSCDFTSTSPPQYGSDSWNLFGISLNVPQTSIVGT